MATTPDKKLVGVDVFLDVSGVRGDDVAERLAGVASGSLQLKMITNRGVKVWPNGLPETTVTDHWRCRFLGNDNEAVTHRQVLGVLDEIERRGLDFIKTEHLCMFGNEAGFSLGQGQ
jgi:isocitrate dehydrogenase